MEQMPLKNVQALAANEEIIYYHVRHFGVFLKPVRNEVIEQVVSSLMYFQL